MIKNIKLLVTLFSMATVFSCDEDKISPLVSDDGVAPGSVEIGTDAVRDYAGGSEITYNLPDDKDVMYVLGEFQRANNGEVVGVKSSVFNNQLLVEGFAEAGERVVNLYAVDQSGNTSEGVSVTVNPEKPAYKYVCETIYAEPTYGGLNLFWENPEEGVVNIELYSVGESGGLIFQDVIRTESSLGTGQILGLPAEETDFVIIVKDRFDNKCNQIKFTATPLYIEVFDRSKMQAIFQHYDQNEEYGWTLDRLLDGTVGNNGFHTEPELQSVRPDEIEPYYLGYEIDGTPWRVPMFTIDLGDVYSVYRFRYWPRIGYEWRHGNAKEFDLWGSDKLNPDGSLDGWTLLLDNAQVVKPSGTECDNGSTTEEDLSYAQAGLSFDISPDMPKVRYIRFALRVNQECTNTKLVMSEVEFSGDNR